MNHSTPRKFTALLALAMCATAACGQPAPKRQWTPADHGQPERSADDREPALDESAQMAETGENQSARAAGALFIATCAGCHGRDGRGQGEARPPGAQLPDFSAEAWQRSRSDAQLAQMIRDGRGMMPAFKKRISDEGIAVLVQHVRRLGVEAPTEGAAASPESVVPREPSP
jgi:mono/diheme cytochrome c family protein